MSDKNIIEITPENDANQFAIELLMPTEMFKASFLEYFPGGVVDLAGQDPKIKSFAELWEVSEYLICFRLGQLSKK